MITELEVMHIWTKECVKLPIETISATLLTVRWGQAGVYEVDLRTNKIRSKSVAARRKHPHCPWTVVDIESVRKRVREHLTPNRKEQQESFKRHVQGMPGQWPSTRSK